MASSESRKIRAAFISDADSVQTPIESQRRDWENAAAQTILPADTTIEAVTIGGIACEWVRCGTVDERNVLLFLHGGWQNAHKRRISKQS